MVAQTRKEIEQDAGSCGIARTLWNMNNRPGAVALIQAGLAGRGIVRESSKVEKALESLFASTATLMVGAAQPASPEPDLLAFRRAEFNIIRNEVNDSERIPNLRVIPTAVPRDLTLWFTKVNLVERLRETRVFYGFDRLEQNTNPLTGMPEAAMRQLFRNPPAQPQDRWLPAVEVFGEGIYLELKEDRVRGYLNLTLIFCFTFYLTYTILMECINPLEMALSIR
ncbi:MAG: hypothetical protein HZB82_01940 [Deltaproteobacteria bacterium]|nr:hypothetical protein [Deltaproteobacteria bacterium]